MIKEYIQYQMQGRHLSARTCQEYEKDLRYFARWAKEQGLRWSTIETRHLQAYQQACSNLSGATTNKRLTAIRSLFAWMQAQGWVKENPAQDLQSVRTHHEKKETVKTDYDHYLVQPSKSREEQDAKMLYALLLETGCRIGEVIDLQMTDVKENELCIDVIGKGNKKRRVYYGKRTAYMYEQRKKWDTGPRLFEEYGQRHFRYILSLYFDTEQQHVHPHMLRHTFATTAYEKGMPIKDLSGLLGHSSQRTTERYLEVSDAHLQRQYTKYMN